jgi:peptidoglycan/LPS O-acetylase OafA/YrhL
VLAGIGGFVGSILGNAGGRTMLFVGGVVGGLLTTWAGTRIGVWRGWVPRVHATRTALYACAAFLLAVVIIVNTLSTPFGALLSPALVGFAAVLGASDRSGRSMMKDSGQ